MLNCIKIWCFTEFCNLFQSILWSFALFILMGFFFISISLYIYCNFFNSIYVLTENKSRDKFSNINESIWSIWSDIINFDLILMLYFYSFWMPRRHINKMRTWRMNKQTNIVKCFAVGNYGFLMLESVGVNVIFCVFSAYLTFIR